MAVRTLSQSPTTDDPGAEAPATDTRPAGVACALPEPTKRRTVSSAALMEGALRDALSYMDAMAVLRGGEAEQLRKKIRDVLARVDFENICTQGAIRDVSERHGGEVTEAFVSDMLKRREELLAHWPGAVVVEPDAATTEETSILALAERWADLHRQSIRLCGEPDDRSTVLDDEACAIFIALKNMTPTTPLEAFAVSAVVGLHYGIATDHLSFTGVPEERALLACRPIWNAAAMFGLDLQHIPAERVAEASIEDGIAGRTAA